MSSIDRDGGRRAGDESLKVLSVIELPLSLRFKAPGRAFFPGALPVEDIDACL